VVPAEYGLRGLLTKEGGKMVAITARGTAGVSVEIGPLDIDMLKKQRIELLENIWKKEGSSLWGIVYMLDDILDEEEDTRPRIFEVSG
jgi:hypothetical protein